MNQIGFDGERVRAAGTQVEYIAARLADLANRARQMAAMPANDCFPAIPEGQDIAHLWIQARQTFALGLDIVTRGVARLGGGLHSAANTFDRADESATTSVTQQSLPELPL